MMQNRSLLEVHVLVVTIAQEGSFIRASRKLGIAQPSLTRRVAMLEQVLGAKLFHRNSRHVELTKAGALFVMESTLSLKHADRAWDLARYQAQLDAGPIQIGYSPYIYSAVLPLLYRMSPQGEESVGIQLESSPTLELVENVLRGKLHAALGILPVKDDDLWIQPLGTEEFSVCLPKSHSLAMKRDLTVKDLDGQIIFWFPKRSHPRFYRKVMKYMQSVGVQPVFKEVWSNIHALELAAQGFGLALIPRSSSRISKVGVVFKPLADRYLRIESALFMRRDQRSGLIKDFVDELHSRLVRIKSNFN